MFEREKVIDILIDDDIDALHYDDYSYFVDILRSGFKGYDNMTDNELIKECIERDISYLVGEDD